MEAMHINNTLNVTEKKSNNSNSDENSLDNVHVVGSSTSSLDSLSNVRAGNFAVNTPTPLAVLHDILPSNTQQPIQVRASRSLPIIQSGFSKNQNGKVLNLSEILENKVNALENKVSEQNCEIVLLKSALADVLRRMSVVEEASRRSNKGRMIPATPVTQPMAYVSPSRSKSPSNLQNLSRYPGSDSLMTLQTPVSDQNSDRVPQSSSSSQGLYSSTPARTSKNGTEISQNTSEPNTTSINTKSLNDKLAESAVPQHQAPLHEPSALVKALLRSSLSKSPTPREVPVKDETPVTMETIKSSLTPDNEVVTKNVIRNSTPVVEKSKPKKSKSLQLNGTSLLRKSWGSETNLSSRPRSNTVGSIPCSSSLRNKQNLSSSSSSSSSLLPSSSSSSSSSSKQHHHYLS